LRKFPHPHGGPDEDWFDAPALGRRLGSAAR
jgi:hypothetical protein